MKPQDCKAAVETLARRTPPVRALSDPVHLILWENIGYLIDDERRAGLFAEFEQRIGLDATSIARARRAPLLDIAKRGGMGADKRVERWREIAKIVRDQAQGDLAAALKALPVPKARALLKSFPGIGDPGADKILLFAGRDIRPALDSNGLRTMLRLGLSLEGTSYGASYKAAVRTLSERGVKTRAWFIKAYETLRHHGQTLCKRAGPNCLACPLSKACARAELKGQY
jgi:endonuclease III